MNRVALLLVLLSGCSDTTRADRSLRAVGLEPVEFTGYEYFGCGNGDAVHTGFVARNQRGETVRGVVCCGFVGKNCTVRFE